MSIMLLLTVTGILATCIFGALALKHVIKPDERTRLAFYEEASIPLFQSIVQSIEGIEIKYHGEPASPSLVLLKACVANTGHTDIDKSSVHKPLTLSLPKSFKWLKAKIVSSSPEVNAAWKLADPNNLIFSWDLLKPNEYFRFDALAETPSVEEEQESYVSPAKTLRQNITFLHRIASLRGLDRERLRVQSPLRRFLGFPVGVVLLAGGILYIVLSFFPTLRVDYIVERADGTKTKVSVKGKVEQQLLLKEVGGDFRDEIKASELLTKYRATPVISQSKTELHLILPLGVLMIISSGWIFWRHFREIKRERKKLRMVELLE